MRMHKLVSNCPSVIGWMGGKTKLRPTIIACFPPHRTYVEIFAGSATVFFGKPPSKIEIINDLHMELVNLMKVISGTYFDAKIREEFIDYVRNMPAARSVFEEWKHWNKDKLKTLSPAQRAFRFYYVVKKGFSSCPKCGYEASPFSGNRYNMKTDFDKFSERFRKSGAQIECMDFSDLIAKYNRPDADSFFFADPPYFVSDSTNYYELNFTPEQHKQFRDCCREIDEVGNKFLITYDDIQDVLDLYDGFYIYRTDDIVYTSADQRGKRDLVKTELFITNYDISKSAFKPKTDDLFADIIVNNKRIDIPGKIGLERIR